jgi:hypothetical protein
MKKRWINNEIKKNEGMYWKCHACHPYSDVIILTITGTFHVIWLHVPRPLCSTSYVLVFCMFNNLRSEDYSFRFFTRKQNPLLYRYQRGIQIRKMNSPLISNCWTYKRQEHTTLNIEVLGHEVKWHEMCQLLSILLHPSMDDRRGISNTFLHFFLFRC